MSTILEPIESTALPREDAALRAIFSQITAEIRKKGVVLNEEDGSFYVSKRFSWKSTVKDFFDAYHKICERKQVHPIYQESKLTTALKVPYADIETIHLFHGGVVKRLMQFKGLRIPPFSKLPDHPSTEDLFNIRRLAAKDKDICRFIDLVLVVDEELREYVSQLDRLADAYMLRISAYSMAVRGTRKKSAVKKKDTESKRTIETVLAPYIGRLKRIGAIPSSWKYSFRALPLTDEGKDLLAPMVKNPDLMSYWDKDILPFQPFRKAEERKRVKERERAEEEAEKRRKREERERLKKARKVSRPSHGFELSRPSLWHRFDRWVTRVGKGLAYRIDDITDWMMHAAMWVAILFAAIAVIAVWVDEGLFAAIILVVIGAVIFGLLEGIAGVLAMVVKYVSYVPLYAVRIILYRGWTLLLAVLVGCGLVAYLVLEAQYLF